MSHTVHGEPGLHKQAALNHKLAENFNKMEAEHHDKIAIAAYYCAEHRGFSGGDCVTDWLTAEAEINAMLNLEEDANVH